MSFDGNHKLIYINIMRLISIRNVFESSRFTYFMNKLICNLFLTFRKSDKGDEYTAVTTSFDMLVFIISLGASILSFADILKTPLTRTPRSLILELSMFANGKLRTIQPFLVICSSFFNRYKYFELLRTFQIIDDFVSMDTIIICVVTIKNILEFQMSICKIW